MLLSEEQFQLEIMVCPDYQYLAEVVLFDAYNRQKEGVTLPGEIRFRLPKGIYTLRVQISAEVKDTLVVLKEDLRYFIGTSEADAKQRDALLIVPPPIYSSVPLLGNVHASYKSSHEYYTYPAIHTSSQATYTHPLWQQEDASSLFLFLRFPSREKYDELKGAWKKDFCECYALFDETGELLIAFDDTTKTVKDAGAGSLAVNAELPPGLYYLRCESESENRLIPLYVYRHRQTQFFLTLGKTSLFGSIRIFISRRKGFEPQLHMSKLIDVLLDKMQNGDWTIPGELLEQVMDIKFEWPIVAILCLYIYLKGNSSLNDTFFRAMLANLEEHILPDSHNAPDIRALHLMAAGKYKQVPADTSAIQGIPMLRVGFEAVVRASADYPGLIAGYSPNDFISENGYSDSPYITFREGSFFEERKKAMESPLDPLGYYRQVGVPSLVVFTGNENTEEINLPGVEDWFGNMESTLTGGTTAPADNEKWDMEPPAGAGFDADDATGTDEAGNWDSTDANNEEAIPHYKKFSPDKISFHTRSAQPVSATRPFIAGTNATTLMLDAGGDMKTSIQGWLPPDVLSHMNKPKSSNTNWLPASLGNLLQQEKDTSISDAARKLGVSPNTILRVLNEALAVSF